mmetsp:Transcript_2061/g.3290  ORF Transcript_2061/g.3290 Transcript_2061/m.3290 type:complete len:156 (+) Transcript_2061:485-952(+)|eukprot:CAMPEP_0184306426 /NCGR_PEP_ID=MMETSP1049-20130417/15425_1 /TAXON_ID=77928 /ORGANISM="Proteomonas sulcata, Strain CCMP704" /LENGTH=155 /DNA_ID=CAMNT_0026618681 /DNA_START=335 /DNA_END=802 /DNA_ORIENTATION=+
MGQGGKAAHSEGRVSEKLLQRGFRAPNGLQGEGRAPEKQQRVISKIAQQNHYNHQHNDAWEAHELSSKGTRQPTGFLSLLLRHPVVMSLLMCFVFLLFEEATKTRGQNATPNKHVRPMRGHSQKDGVFGPLASENPAVWGPFADQSPAVCEPLAK